MDLLILHITLLLLTIASHAISQEMSSWQLKLLPAIAVVPPMPLTIHQSNHQDLSTTAPYQTQSLQLPPDYSSRLSTFKHNKGWSLEINYQNTYPKNTTSEIQQFSVSLVPIMALHQLSGTGGKF